ncbi:MAG: D-alanyl-D-alanine carboxypeptidase/D-alanyl-D-alanine-endopeptidase, partial [Ilumatobacter sp.]|uniref:D-alanyl-D-alanine carboxypeptidase/D-alanyl-D-alanine endopeptidase n=1 Tax=Ilumatobacter sp. TaxID=1967498 RepID=UPI003C721F4C
ADDEPTPTDPADTTDGLDDGEVGGDATPALTTSFFDYRRAPQAVASVASASQLEAAMDPVFGFVGPTSCAAVAVDGVSVAATNADVPVTPASNQKLFVALAALEILGPEFRFTTSVAVPPAQEGVVDGDIYLIGGGDPVLTSDDYPIEEDRQPVVNATSFDTLADGLVDAGITRIRGTVIGDGTRYDDEWVIDEWAEGVAFVEAGPYDSLLANDARVLGRSGLQEDPNEGAAREFVRLLNDRGIRVDNGWGSGIASSLVPVVATVDSEPLSAIIGEMLLTSDDNTAEMLLKEIGFAASGQGTREAGLNAMTQTIEALGVDMEDVSFRDGSGLSNQNRATCSALLDVVQLARGTSIEAGWPVAAESGTLADEFGGTEMAGRLRGKTGTLTGVKALSGVVEPRSADADTVGTIEFVIVLNLEGASSEELYRPLWAAIGERFATYPAGPSSDSLGPR